MPQELMNMAGFKGGGPSDAFKAAYNPATDDESLSDGIGGSYGIIKYKGKVWSLVYRGEQHFFVKEDGYPLEYLDIIILQQAKIKSKSYFLNYEDGSTDAPLCASIDGVRADAGVPQMQGINGDGVCAMCPRNVWKTSPDGKKVRECQDYKRIAVLLMPAQTKKLLGEPLLEPVFLRIPGASLEGLSRMGDETKRQGYHFWTFITRVDFDPTQAYPKMRFRAIQQLTDKEAPVVLPMRQDPLALRIIGFGEQRPALAAPSPPPPANTVPPQQRVETGLIDATPAKPTPAPSPPPPTPAPATAPVQQPKPAPAPVSPPTPAPAADILVDTGLGGATLTTPAAPLPAAAQGTIPAATGPVGASGVITPAGQTIVTDTGEPTQADADLDARIAALMPS